MTMTPMQRIRVTPSAVADPALPAANGAVDEAGKMPVGVRRNISVQGFVKDGKAFPTENRGVKRRGF